jgi:ribonuclease G
MDRIITDDKSVYEEIKTECVSLCPILTLYEDGTYPLDKLLGISSKLKKALEKRVWLKSGGNLVIEPTEALTVIDVNTGKAIEGKRSRETTFFLINCEAAKEAARQIRIRNISGIILIDFIDMKEKENRTELMNQLRQYLQQDKTKTVLVDITKLGLVEITRMKQNPPLHEILQKNLDKTDK